MKRIFIDANILIEILMSRRLANNCVLMLQDASRQYTISALTVHIVWYIAEKYSIDQKLVDEILTGWEILPITQDIIKSARERYDGKDFEDCLQAVCAEVGDCESIITIDKQFQQHSSTNLSVILIQ